MKRKRRPTTVLKVEFIKKMQKIEKQQNILVGTIKDLRKRYEQKDLRQDQKKEITNQLPLKWIVSTMITILGVCIAASTVAPDVRPEHFSSTTTCPENVTNIPWAKLSLTLINLGLKGTEGTIYFIGKNVSLNSGKEEENFTFAIANIQTRSIGEFHSFINVIDDKSDYTDFILGYTYEGWMYNIIPNNIPLFKGQRDNLILNCTYKKGHSNGRPQWLLMNKK